MTVKTDTKKYSIEDEPGQALTLYVPRVDSRNFPLVLCNCGDCMVLNIAKKHGISQLKHFFLQA